MKLYRTKKIFSMIKAFSVSISRHISIKSIQKCYIHKNATLSSNGFLEIGSCEVLPNALISAAVNEAHLSLGESTYIGRNTIIACRKRIAIGNNVLIGPNVLIYDHDHNYDEHGRKPANVEDAYKVGEVVIEDNVWIGGGVIILRNSHIGKNSIIGAGVLIKGNVPENSIVTKKEDISTCLLERRK